MIKNNILSYEIEDDGIATITIDMLEYSTNLFSPDFIKTYFDICRKAINDSKVKGVIVKSAKSMFMAGADLKILQKPVTDAAAFLGDMLDVHRVIREVECSGKAFVAIINGHALGGGLEVCLSCHHRIAVDNDSIKIGFPEIKVGLLPGAGGTAKTPYLLGLQNGLNYLLQGLEVNPKKALKDGLINAIVSHPDQLVPSAKKWILENPKPVQPWDNRSHKIPGGGLFTPGGAQVMVGAIGNVRKLTHGNYPAAQYILSVVHDGIQTSIDRALEIEARYFTKAIMSKEARNMIRTGFIAIQEAKKGKARPQGIEKYQVSKLGILGAGMMGAGIAYVSARAGMNVVLKDISTEAAQKGKDYSAQLIKYRQSKGRMTHEEGEQLLNKIEISTQIASLETCDLVIEAVFENPDLKAKVTKETEAVLSSDKIFASNTSTIPISLLAKASKRPENFIGIHFFSPVDKMPLVEIIVGEKTNDRTIAAAVDYVVAINKIPIVVNDSRGFFTSRCFGTYCAEGAFLLEEGVPPAMIENVAKNKGMPVGPLAVTDEVSLTLGMHVYESDPTPNKPEYLSRMYAIQKLLVNEHGRQGKKSGKGYYDYPEGGKKKLWTGLNMIFNSDSEKISKDTIAKRLMHRQALESFRCLEEGVLRNATDGDIGSILGWGFPIYTGGALSYIDYIGIATFIRECEEFERIYGARFKVSDGLRFLAKNAKSVHEFKLREV